MLLGRESELAALLESLRRREALVVVGEAGVGKTALLREAVKRAGLASFEGGGLATLSWLSYLPIARALGTQPPEGDDAAVAAACAEQVGDGVLVLDDLHWADADTAALLPLLAGRVRLLVALRRGDPATSRRLEQARAAGIRVLELESLAPGAAAEFVRARRPDLSEERVKLVLLQAAGNPFLLEELSDSPEGSETLRLSFAARFEQLSARGREAVARLALLGRPAARELAGPGAAEALEVGLALRQADGLIGLRHALIAEAAVVSLADRERRDLHAQLARAVDEPGEAARHHAAAGEREPAYRAALAAADRARHPAEAARHLGLAATSAPEAEAVELHLSAGLALVRAGQSEEALALAEAIRVEDAVTGARAAEIKALARLELNEEWAAGERDADAGLALLSGADPRLEARLLLTKARYRSADWDGEGSLSLSEQALRLLHSAGGPDAAALAMWGQALYAAGDEGCISELAGAADAARREGDRATELEAAFQRASALADFGRVEELEQAGRWLERRARSLELRRWELRAGYLMTSFDHFVQADWSAAIDRARGLRQERAALGMYARIVDSTLALALADGGDDRAALALLEEALEGETSAGARGRLLWALGEVHWLARRPLEAIRACAETIAHGTVYDLFAELTAAWARRDGAVAPLPSPRASPDAAMGWSGPLIAERVAHTEPSPAAFDRAAAEWEGRWLAAGLRCRWAAAEAALETDDVEDARRRLIALEARLEELCLTPLLGRVRRSLRRAGVRRSAPRRSADGVLTAREREVLELVAEGLTSAAIGARLGIAPATVDSQAKSAMRKLGAKTRRQAATVATGQ